MPFTASASCREGHFFCALIGACGGLSRAGKKTARKTTVSRVHFAACRE
jgi:hypothetical protein